MSGDLEAEWGLYGPAWALEASACPRWCAGHRQAAEDAESGAVWHVRALVDSPGLTVAVEQLQGDVTVDLVIRRPGQPPVVLEDVDVDVLRLLRGAAAAGVASLEAPAP